MPDINSTGVVRGARCAMFVTDDDFMVRNDCNIMVARNRRWFGSANREVFNDQVRIPGALVGDMNAARGACGQDGTIGLWPGYPDGWLVRFLAMDGSVTEIPDAFPQGNGTFCILDRNTGWWQDGFGRERTVGMLLPVMLPGDKHNRNLFRWQGKIWLAYQSAALSKIVTHPEDSLHGYVIADVTHQQPQYYLMARETARGIVLATASTPMDDPRDGVLVDFSAPRVDLAALLTKPEPDPEPQPQPEPEPDPMPDIPTPDPRLVQIVTDHWNASGVAEETARDFHKFSEGYWKHRHARVLYEGLSVAYHDKGIKSFGVYPKTGGTRFVPFPDKPNEAYAEDIVQILNAAGVMFYKDVGVQFGGKSPSLNWGEFSRSSDADQHPGAYLPPPRLSVSQQPPPDDDEDEPQPVPSDLQKRLAALEAKVKALEAKPSGGINGKRIALRCEDGTFIWAVGGGSDDVRAKHPHDKPGSEPGGHETFTVVER